MSWLECGCHVVMLVFTCARHLCTRFRSHPFALLPHSLALITQCHTHHSMSHYIHTHTNQTGKKARDLRTWLTVYGYWNQVGTTRGCVCLFDGCGCVSLCALHDAIVRAVCVLESPAPASLSWKHLSARRTCVVASPPSLPSLCLYVMPGSLLPLAHTHTTTITTTNNHITGWAAERGQHVSLLDRAGPRASRPASAPTTPGDATDRLPAPQQARPVLGGAS